MNQNLPNFGSNTRKSSDAPFDVVAIVASAEGLNALTEVLSALPIEFPVAVLVVQHLQRDHKSMMVEILNRRTPMKVQQAEAGDRLQPGIVYVAPPNYHLSVCEGGTLALSQTPLLNFVRPAADRLLESLAKVYRERAIAVVLTGMGIDGTTGVVAIKQEGGKVIAQDEVTSAHFGMPGSAIHSGVVDWVLPLTEVAATLISLVMEGQE